MKIEEITAWIKTSSQDMIYKLKSALNFQGLENSKCETSLFFTRVKSKIIILLIYVDDIIITSDNNKGIEELIGSLNEAFSFKDLGDLNFFLGMHVTRKLDTIFPSQAKYVQDLLTKIEMSGYKGIEAPFSTTKKLKKDKWAKFHNPTLYRSFIGSLQYTVLTRPKLAFSMNKPN